MVRIRAFRQIRLQGRRWHLILTCLNATAVLDRPLDNLPCNLIGASAEGGDYCRHPFAFDRLPGLKAARADAAVARRLRENALNRNCDRHAS